MTYSALRVAATKGSVTSPPEQAPHGDAPGLLRNRFLLIGDQEVIEYDKLLSLASTHGVTSPIVRRAMYLVWAWRDDRIRRFVVEEIADSKGRWSVKRAEDKSRLRFFEQFGGTAESARKARSNFEFFLRETGIIVGTDVTLRPTESWLPEAMQAAAQHEPDPAVRARMLRDPIDLLFSLRLNGLADLTESDRRTLALAPVATLDDKEADDEQIPSATSSDTKQWTDRSSVGSTSSTKTIAFNAVALERASASHLMLERLFAEALRKAGLKPLHSASIDMLAHGDTYSVVCEIKSCTDRNFHAQVRRGVSQLLEYRWRYRKILPNGATLVLLVESKPPKNKMWLLEYLRSIGVELIWKERGSNALLMEAPVPLSLLALVTGI